VKRSMIYTALAVLALSTPAAAQGYPPGAVPPGAVPSGAMPPYEILSMLRSTGYEPIGQPVRRGPNYVLRAIDDSDREVSLVVSARSGDILSATPVRTASRMPPLPPGVSMGPYERMPPGYIPPSGPRRYGPPIVDDDDDETLPPPGFGYNAPRPPGAVPGPPPRSSSAAPPPSPPRGGSMPPDDDDVASPPSGLGGSNVITADPDRSGMLPPPPERFPQRAAPAQPPKPKPVARAAAAAPKAAPLPKPKPGATADAPSASAQPAWPSAPEPARAPAKSSPAEETPH
jgi:hypothetical protein